ncbi:MAG TPA: response regulator, partial [candidate division Zixibacteria bacterium]|nr:response regulator [candidate division Zixibacteria bacterium]
MGLNLLITEEPDMQVVGEAWDEQTAINQVRKLAPDVVVMDIQMPGKDGIEATRRISSKFPDTKIIALSIHGERHFVEDMLQAGASGYVLKESIPEELVDGIKSVAQGEVYLSEAVRDAVVSGYVSILSREEKASELAKHYDTADGPILVTKLHRPRISASTVPRVRLWEQLEAGRGRPLTLVSAPAGYGKSTVISQWLETYECPSAWLSLDEQDSDLRTFLAYLTAAIQTLFPGAVPRTTALLKAADLPPLRILAGTLINEIEDVSQRFVLVIDDYHRINEPSVHDLLGEILRHSPQHLHLVLATRTDPPLDLLQLRAYRQMGEIRGHDLRFTRDETRALLQQVMDAPVGKEVATLLTARTDGWAIGLHLITLALRDVHDLENISITLPGEQQTLDYLVAEALSRQPREIQSWLLKSSILDRFQAPLCEAVCAAPGESAAPPGQGISAGINGEAFLDWLRGNNLFVISLDNHGRWFRYHHLFQQLLQSQLAMAIDDGDIAALHGRASAWLAENGLIEESFQHALAAGDIPGAAQLVKQHRYSMMNAEQWSRLNQLLDMLPPEATENNPSLLLAKAFCFDYRGEMAEVSTLFNRVKPLVVGVLPESPDDIGVQGEYYSLLAELNYLSAEGKLALASSKKALELLPSEAQYIRNLARNWYVFSLQMKGDLARGLQVVYEAIDSPVNLKRTTNIMGYRCLCALYFMDGDLSRLKQSALRVLTLAEEQQLSESLGIAGYFLGTLHYLRNELAEASKYIDININNRYSARVAYHAQCAFVQALIYISQGQPEEAWSVVESVIAFGDETHNAYVMEA